MNYRKVRIHDSFGPRPSSGVEVEWMMKKLEYTKNVYTQYTDI